MIRDLNIDTELIVCETIREQNGLAKSSRNTFLTHEQKQKASALYFILNEGKRLILEEKISDADFIYDYASEILKEKAPEFELQYFCLQLTLFRKSLKRCLSIVFSIFN